MSLPTIENSEELYEDPLDLMDEIDALKKKKTSRFWRTSTLLATSRKSPISRVTA